MDTPTRINPAGPVLDVINFELDSDRKRQIVRSRAEMPCLDVVLTGVHVSLENNEYPPNFGGNRYFICYLFF